MFYPPSPTNEIRAGRKVDFTGKADYIRYVTTVAGRPYSLFVAILCVALIPACASLEKKVDLTYGQVAPGAGNAGDVGLATPVFEKPLPGLPGGRLLLGTVRGTTTIQIVTEDDPRLWIMNAVEQQLGAAGYTVRNIPALPASVDRGVLVRVRSLSSNQDSDVIVLTTNTDIALAVEVWKDGRLKKTLTASASSQDEGLDRSGEVVAASLRKNLTLTLQELMPGILDTPLVPANFFSRCFMRF